jgi:hypothetical protein
MIGPLSGPAMAFQADDPLLADNGVVDDPGGKVEAVAGAESELRAALGQTEGDTAPDHVDDF